MRISIPVSSRKKRLQYKEDENIWLLMPKKFQILIRMTQIDTKIHQSSNALAYKKM